jgi:hypothetical protein
VLVEGFQYLQKHANLEDRVLGKSPNPIACLLEHREGVWVHNFERLLNLLLQWGRCKQNANTLFRMLKRLEAKAPLI